MTLRLGEPDAAITEYVLMLNGPELLSPQARELVVRKLAEAQVTARSHLILFDFI